MQEDEAAATALIVGNANSVFRESSHRASVPPSISRCRATRSHQGTNKGKGKAQGTPFSSALGEQGGGESCTANPPQP